MNEQVGICRDCRFAHVMKVQFTNENKSYVRCFLSRHNPVYVALVLECNYYLRDPRLDEKQNESGSH